MQRSAPELSTPVADSVYAKNIYVKNSFAYAEDDDGYRVKYPLDAKLAGFRSQLEVSRVSSHAAEL